MTDSFETALYYCFAPLQNQPWAERSLVIVRPDEYEAILLIRRGEKFEAYHARSERRYSIRILENLLTEESPDLETALAQFGRRGYISLRERNSGPAHPMPIIEALGLVAAWIREAAMGNSPM